MTHHDTLQLPEQDRVFISFLFACLFCGKGCKGRGQIQRDRELSGVGVLSVKFTIKNFFKRRGRKEEEKVATT